MSLSRSADSSSVSRLPRTTGLLQMSGPKNVSIRLSKFAGASSGTV
jgi:hypothetical protein